MPLVSAMCFFFPSLGVVQCLADGGDLVTGVERAVQTNTTIGTALTRTDSIVQTDMFPAPENAGSATEIGVDLSTYHNVMSFVTRNQVLLRRLLLRL